MMLDGVNMVLIGLLIYNINIVVIGGSGVGYYYFNGIIWECLIMIIDLLEKWFLIGDVGIVVGINFLGIIDNNVFFFRMNNIEKF